MTHILRNTAAGLIDRQNTEMDGRKLVIDTNLLGWDIVCVLNGRLQMGSEEKAPGADSVDPHYL